MKVNRIMTEPKKPTGVIDESEANGQAQTPDQVQAPNPITESPIAGAQVCAGCGETVVFDKSRSVGGREPIQYHGCDQMEATLHQYWLDSMNEPNTPVPATVA